MWQKQSGVICRTRTGTGGFTLRDAARYTKITTGQVFGTGPWTLTTHLPLIERVLYQR